LYALALYRQILSSSRLEGNTYTRLDTEKLLAQGEEPTGRDPRDTQMILNHKKAIELMVDGASVIRFNRYTLLNLHAALAENLLDDANDEGKLRQREVGITGTTFIPLSIPQKICCCRRPMRSLTPSSRRSSRWSTFPTCSRSLT